MRVCFCAGDCLHAVGSFSILIVACRFGAGKLRPETVRYQRYKPVHTDIFLRLHQEAILFPFHVSCAAAPRSQCLRESLRESPTR